jgi:UDP-N-acetylmuramoylalanine--D-glutamate ligase
MGLGVHGGGLGVVRWLLRQGAYVTVTDKASAETLAQPIADIQKTLDEETIAAENLQYVLGGHREEDFTSHDMIVVNPAVRPDSPWLKLAEAAEVPVETEMTLFFRQFAGPILGITGTKGKTTTAMLTGAMLKQHYPDTLIAGNLRVSALAALNRLKPTTPVVLELSSFQLVRLGMAGLSPSYACITNLSPDHLNYHETMDDYAQAKRQIFLHQQLGEDTGDAVVVLNHDEVDFWLASFPGTAPANSAQKTSLKRHVLTFSTCPDSGADVSITRQGSIVYAGEPLFHVDDIQLVGTHNRANVLAAAGLAARFGIHAEQLRAAVQNFRGVKHRLEVVGEIGGVRYINDTTATNPVAAQAALASFEQPVVLIAGGADKGLDVGALPHDIVRRARVLVLLAGSATPPLEQAVRAALDASDKHSAAQPVSQPCLDTLLGPYDDFETAIRVAHQHALPGEVVLLSPGCASFGMFRNEFHRGDEFRRIVQSLQQSDTGQE